MASLPLVIKGLNAIDHSPIEFSLSGKTQPTVVVFLSAACPCSDSHIPFLKKLKNEFPQINFLAIHSNMDENEKTTETYFKKVNLPFLVVQDSDAKLADTFKAFKTPHAFILSKENQILYEGGVTSSAKAHEASHFHLREALLDLTSGREIKVKEVRTLGCMISREKES
jgi:thiol-disulfide isomerase/thioredoxin